MAIFYTNTSSRKPKPNKSKSFLAAKQKHIEFLQSMGISQSNKKLKNNPANFPDLTVPNKGANLSNSIPENGIKRSVDDYKWRRDRVESKEAIQEAERKKTRVAPLWNKGSVMYITDDQDPTTLGKKI